MNTRSHLLSGIAAVAALAASALATGWLIRSSEYADRPPLYAVVAFLFAIGTGAAGLVLGVRAAKGLMRPTREMPK